MKHYALASWGSGTGAAGLLGAGAYALLTNVFAFGVRSTIGTLLIIPILRIVVFFCILPSVEDYGMYMRSKSVTRDDEPISNNNLASCRVEEEAESTEETFLLKTNSRTQHVEAFVDFASIISQTKALFLP